MRGHKAVSHGDIEEFVAATEHGIPPAGGGDLGFSARGKGHNVDFGPAGLVREISEPTAVGRETTVVLAGRQVRGGGWLEGLAVAGQGQNPIRKHSIFRFQVEREKFSVGRPIDGGTVDISVVLKQNLFGLAAIERAAADRGLAVLSNGVGALFSIGRPYRPVITRPEGDTRRLTAGDGKYPDIVVAGLRIFYRHGDGFAVRRKTRIRIDRERTRSGD